MSALSCGLKGAATGLAVSSQVPTQTTERQTVALDIDRHFRREDFKRYALQCGLAGLVVLVLLLVLDAVTQTVLIAALGASAFVAFAVPRSPHSGPRSMIGGYVVGIVAGSFMSVLNEWSVLTLFVVLAGVIGLSIIKQLVLPALLDLI